MQPTTTLLLCGTVQISLRIGLNAVRRFGLSEANCSIWNMAGGLGIGSIFFVCGKAHAPLLVYIHGGYWQRNAKEFFACLVEGPIAREFDAALVGYTLAPEATLTEIVGEVRMAIHWLRENGPRYDIASAKLIVSGWSAGGHLTAMALADADAGLAISGIFDIEPCRLNYLNDALRLTMEDRFV